MMFFEKIFKPDLKKLKSARDAKSLIEALRKYAGTDRDFSEAISNAIVDIGTLDTLVEIEGMLQRGILAGVKPYSNLESHIRSIARALRKKIAPTASPITLSDDKLKKSWDFNFKNILHTKYQGGLVSIENLKKGYEQGLIPGEYKCENCFHTSVLKLENAVYEVYNGNQLDVERQVKAICLYCGTLDVI